MGFWLGLLNGGGGVYNWNEKQGPRSREAGGHVPSQYS